MTSDSFFIVISRDCTSDIHICGMCKSQFCVLDRFMAHKLLGVCSALPDTGKESSDGVIVKAELPITDVSCVKENFKDTARKDIIQGVRVGLRFKNGKLLSNNCPDISNEESSNNYNSKSLETSLANSSVLKSEKSNPLATIIAANPKKSKTAFCCEFVGCSYKTNMKKDIERHARVHTGERPFKCTLCSKSFNRRDKLLLHNRVHTGDKKYKCTECPYATIDSCTLIKHLRVHKGERPFKCQLCPYRSRDSSQLTVHLRTHTGDSPYMCSHENCKAAFKTHSDLKRHSSVHSTEKNHSCPFCPYRSNLKAALRKHLILIHPDGEPKDLKCNFCNTNSEFATVRKLRNHIKKFHRGEPMESEQVKSGVLKKKDRSSVAGERVGTLAKGFVCQQCNAAFVCKASLETHERFHGKVKQDFANNQENSRVSEDRRSHSESQLSSEGFVDEGRLDHAIKQKQDNNLSLGSALDKRDLHESLLVNDSYLVDGESFEESLRTAELLASFTQQMQASRLFEIPSNILTSMADDLHAADLGIS